MSLVPWKPKEEANESDGVMFGPSNRSEGLLGGDSGMALTASGKPSTSQDILPLSATEDTLTPKDENGHRYVGLVNQAMTCYLNSLLQTLYMTPEFRNAVYVWENRKMGNEENSIPCQLQKLFLLLQTSDNSSLETKDLTTSFGWSSNEAYDQHDVQELCRLMFDALERKWKGTEHEKLIEQHYRGTMEDFVKCLSCGRESKKIDFFLDLPLAVKPFGATQAFNSVEEALAAFVAPELLDGTNQYHCDNCNSKQNAHKGLRITQFPYLLTIQLKRFDFDYTTFNRIKLNDRMSFPDLLDLNGFIEKKGEEEKSAQMETEKNDDDKILDEGVGLDSDKEATVGMEDGEPTKKKVRVGCSLDEGEASSLLQKGPFVYELFSVMVHQGNAAGGHYYAYIKNMEQGKWYCFNDTRVEIATPEEIERSFGGSGGGWSHSNTNAYMLMYRQVNKEKNSSFIRTAALPKHITGLRDRWKQMELEKEQKKKYDESLYKLSIRLNGADLPDVVLEKVNAVYEVSLPRTTELEKVYEEAYKHFKEVYAKLNLPNPPSKNNTRLLKCKNNGVITESYQSKADRGKKTLESTQPHDHLRFMEIHYLFDVKPAQMPIYSTIEIGNTQTLEIKVIDVENEKIRPSFFMPILGKSSSVDVKKWIGSYLSQKKKDFEHYRLLLENRFGDKFEVIDVDVQFDDRLLGSFTAPPVIYVDGGSSGEIVDNDRRCPLQDSRMALILNRNKYGITLKVKLPAKEELSMFMSMCQSPLPETSTSTGEEKMPCENEAALGGSSPGQPVNSSDIDVHSTHSDDGIEVSSGSMCNNTPQMSPVVSEGDDDEVMRGKKHPTYESNVFGWNATDNCDPGTMMEDSRMPGADCSETVESDAASQTTLVAAASALSPPPPPNPSTLRSSSFFDVGILDQDKNVMTLNVDGRSLVRELREWLARQLNVDPIIFSFLVYYDDEEKTPYESQAKDSEDLKAAFGTVKKIVVQPRPALREDEKMIKIIEIDSTEMDTSKWKTLFELPVSRQTLLSELRSRCARVYYDKYQTRLQESQIHFRCVRSKRVEFWGKTSLEKERASNWSEPLYMHIIPEDRLPPSNEVHHVAILVRRFRPSTVELDKIDFVLVDSSVEKESQYNAFLEALSAQSKIPLERLQLAEFTISDWEKWPFIKSRIELLEMPFWKKMINSYTLLSSDCFFNRIGHRVLYYRDMDEASKSLTEEDKKAIRIKEQGHTATVRRKERPLRIQMSSISET